MPNTKPEGTFARLMASVAPADRREQQQAEQPQAAGQPTAAPELPNHQEHRSSPVPKPKHSLTLPVATEDELDRKDMVRTTEAEYQRFKDLENDIRISYGISPPVQELALSSWPEAAHQGLQEPW